MVVPTLYGMAFILFAMQLLTAVASYTYQSLTVSLSVKLNAILVSAIYAKSLRISSKVTKQFFYRRQNEHLLVAVGLLFSYMRVSAVPAIGLYGILIIFEIKIMSRIMTGVRAYSKAMDMRS
ncbi:hypothetical protein HDU87_000198 [Geranomyces variabilis]|uniref:Uncharacterized protein n=1 Tax=Geranomyces variabilis TaxID=109894 RepID=A0AAD5XR63_9FUNG|nr:hypothetical protein HDU87_000198 [Geranomyces variabilis]